LAGIDEAPAGAVQTSQEKDMKRLRKVETGPTRRIEERPRRRYTGSKQTLGVGDDFEKRKGLGG